MKREMFMLLVFFYEIVGLDYNDCEDEAGGDEEVPSNAEHAEYGSIFDERVVDRDVEIDAV
jgi:hypothetical protein